MPSLRYRTLSQGEFSALAGYAASTTAVLTRRLVPADDPDTPHPSFLPLGAEEQADLIDQLKAWAGLEGSDKQDAARKYLEERKRQSLTPALALQSSNGNGAAVSKVPIDTVYFPPDFASHYQAQLRALTEGYYERIHLEDIARARERERRDPDKAPKGEQSTSPSPIATPSPPLHVALTDPIETQRQKVQLARRALERQDDALYGMPGPAYGTSNVYPDLPDAQNPAVLIATAATVNHSDIWSPQVRDKLLQFAHQLYASSIPTGGGKLHPTLLPLLHMLHGLHPVHLPTLLLLSCAYYTAGDYSASLWYNTLILRLDGKYVEAMSNIGTTLRALGRWNEAESWWWRAIRIKPGYWDAYDNLLGVLCSQRQEQGAKYSPSQDPVEVDPSCLPHHDLDSVTPKVFVGHARFDQALALCELVERHVTGWTSPRIATCPATLPTAQIPRLQNLYYTKGNLKFVMPNHSNQAAALEYEHAVELALSPFPWMARSLRDLVVATCVASILTFRVEVPGCPDGPLRLARALNINLADPLHAQMLARGKYDTLLHEGLLGAVHRVGDPLVHTLLEMGRGHLPMVLLPPAAAVSLTGILFESTHGYLPSLIQQARGDAAAVTASVQAANSALSTVIMTLSKLYQDAVSSPAAGPHAALTLGGVAPGTSLLLPMYYLALAVHPSASTCNNLGIILTSIPLSTAIYASGQAKVVSGQSLAMQYYQHGLQLDPNHPHLYTNLGSLVKELGNLPEAIRMYTKAVECNPVFDVALANLGNAIKDQGRTQDSVVYYRRAVAANPNFPEALCGLVNALLAICSWEDVYDGPVLMDRVSQLVNRQLDEGRVYGAGIFASDAPMHIWIGRILATYGDYSPQAQSEWARKLEVLFTPAAAAAAAAATGGSAATPAVAEGSLLLRIAERGARRAMRRWYLDCAQASHRQNALIAPQAQLLEAAHNYPRIPLPARMVSPTVPTVLPFHTFTYPLPARQIRLICHRNALRISHSTLSQAWMPTHVYPPPPMPVSRLKIGYISSDFNNHPLAHLMQSCFGLHDHARFEVFCYATTPPDGSPYRRKIEAESEHFLDVSGWSNEVFVQRIVSDGIHILCNLNGYTKGARNEIFAARPSPVQVEFMGFAGPLVSGWTDWIIADPIACPPEMTAPTRARAAAVSNVPAAFASPADFDGDLDPEGPRDDWVYSERFIYMPHSYFVTDHKQGFREPERASAPDAPFSPDVLWAEEERKRWVARRELFPLLPDDYVIFTCSCQLYKIDPTLFELWLRILQRVPKSIIWLLKFPAAGVDYLQATARRLAGDNVAARIVFTDVAPKEIHIQRGRIADLFLDTTECNAHTTAADVLWSGTPVLTWPKHTHKMCSRVAASVVTAAGAGKQLVTHSAQEYEDRAVHLAQSVQYSYTDAHGRAVPPAHATMLPASVLAFNPTAQAAIGPASGAAAAAAAAVSGPACAPWLHAVHLASGARAPVSAVTRRGRGELAELRKYLFLSRETSALFDTVGWMRALERGYDEAWRRWVAGTDAEDTPEFRALPPDAPERQSPHIWVDQPIGGA